MDIKTILVTGASGKIGRCLVPSLVHSGYRVRATQFKTPLKVPGVEVSQGSIEDPSFVRKALSDVDAVCHLVTCKEDRERFFEVSVRGTFNLLDAARDRERMPQILLASGDAALGIFFNPQPGPLDENAPRRAYPGYYAFSKVLEEMMLEQYRFQYGLPSTILRFSWIQDEDDLLAHMTLAPPGFGVPAWEDLATTDRQKSFFREGRDAAACLVHPEGKPFVRHVVGMRDVVQAFLLALGNPQAVGETFNIAAPAAFSYDVLARYIAERLGLPIVTFTSRDGHDFSIDTNKARALLGYRAEMDVFRMVDESIAFRKTNQRRTVARYHG